MSLRLLLFSFLLPAALAGQNASYIPEIKEFQQNLNSEFANPEESPLTEEDLEKFKSLNFFPIDPGWKITAKFIRTPEAQPFEMQTTTDRKPVYRKYGEAHFEINGHPFSLSVYQNQGLSLMPEYEDYLFLPFNDLTNGEETYGGGRFLDLRIPSGDTIILDFNKAYHPYCVYNHKYSCPVPPRENFFNIEVSAGVKL